MTIVDIDIDGVGVLVDVVTVGVVVVERQTKINSYFVSKC